jgi:hypothetical protein
MQPDWSVNWSWSSPVLCSSNAYLGQFSLNIFNSLYFRIVRG